MKSNQKEKSSLAETRLEDLKNLFIEKLFKSPPEVLKAIWGYSKKKHREDSLKNKQDVNILVFKNFESAKNWMFMSEFGIKYKDYYETLIHINQKIRDTLERHGYKMKPFNASKISEPSLYGTSFTRRFVMKNNFKIYKSVNMGNDEFEALKTKYILNDYEIFRGWCPLCRGIGVMLVLKDNEEIYDQNVPRLGFKLPCIHRFFETEPDKKSTGYDDDIPF